MLCCIVAAALLAGSLIRRQTMLRYLGFVKTPKSDPYGYHEHCELDEYNN